MDLTGGAGAMTPEEAVPDRVLIVDDERSVRRVLSIIMSGGGFETAAAETGEEAIECLRAEAFGCVLVDKNLPGVDGLEVIRVARDVRPYCSCVMITGYASVESAVEALRLGADDYLEKPLRDQDLMVERLRALIRTRREEYRRNLKLAALVARDPLTGLFNHVYFHQELARAVANAKRTGLPVSLIFMDLDGFKKVNDTLGHQVGDQVLVQLADKISPQADPAASLARLRTQDILARYGGDEFAAILISTAKSGGAVVAERMRQTIEAHDFGLPGFSRQTLSAGVATFPDDADDETELVRAADIAVYAAKH